MKGDTAIAVNPATHEWIKEIAEFEHLPKKSVVSNAVRFYYNYWNNGEVR